MRKGAIVLARFPFTDLSGSKRRPALVLTTQDKGSPDVILAFIYSVVPETIRNSKILLDAKDNHFPLTGLRKSSIIKLDKIATLDKERITGEMGEVGPQMMDLVKEKLKAVLELT